MAVLFPIVAGSVLWVICGFTWLARRDAVQRTRDIGKLKAGPTEQLTWMVGQLAAVEGRALAAGPDPVGDETAWSEVELEREDTGESTWRAETEPTLRVVDEAGDELTVEMTAAEIQLPWEVLGRAEDEPSERMREALERAGADVPKTERGARYALRRRGLAPDDAVTVVGVPRLQPEVVVTPRAGLCIVTGDPLATLQARENADLRALGSMLIGGAILGVVFLAVGVLAIAFS